MATWGLVPAAGAGSRIQPLAFSKELLPVGSRFDNGVERPRAVSEFIVERLIAGGADRLCFVISPGKSDILEYYGGEVMGVPTCYVVQAHPAGLCDAIFRTAPFIGSEDSLLIGLPDTVWFPCDALRTLPRDHLALLLFPVERPELFDAVVTRSDGRVVEVQVKQPRPTSSWVWGAIGMPGRVLHDLHGLWRERHGRDEYIGGLINVYLERGTRAEGVRAGEAYVDVGTLHGYREAIGLLQRLAQEHPDPAARVPPATDARGR
ncbi:MAG TPA: sugar phosphate nucleotidyltransferase [Vicinamibacterales bacterium]